MRSNRRWARDILAGLSWQLPNSVSMKIACILNPQAHKGGAARQWPRLRAELEPTVVLLDELTCAGHSIQAAALQWVNNPSPACWMFAAANPPDKAAAGVDLRAIGGGGIGDSGHLIMTTADDVHARTVLNEDGYTFVEGESILAEVDDKPGGMARLSRALADAGVNVYGHLFLGRWGDRAMFTFVVDKPDVARLILERKG